MPTTLVLWPAWLDQQLESTYPRSHLYAAAILWNTDKPFLMQEAVGIFRGYKFQQDICDSIICKLEIVLIIGFQNIIQQEV